MKASNCSFNDMLAAAAKDFSLATATSYLQVEYGLDELEACWDGFVHTSDHHGLEFRSRKNICSEFSNALNEYIEYLGESFSLQVGS